MTLATIARSFIAICILLGTAFGVEARQSLTEDELDQTMAGGIEYRVVGDETEAVVVDDNPDLFFNQIYGENEVITRVVVEIIASMAHVSFMQANQIDQDGKLADIGPLAEQNKNVVLVLKGQDNGGSKPIVVNNVAGSNEVETAINLTFVVPTAQAGAIGGYTNPFAGGAGPASGPTGGITNNNPTAAPTPIPTSAPQNNVPQFQRPTTLDGAVSLMQGLSQQNPAAAPGLQQGISTVQSLQR